MSGYLTFTMCVVLVLLALPTVYVLLYMLGVMLGGVSEVVNTPILPRPEKPKDEDL